MNLRTSLALSSFLALGLSSSALAGWGDATGGGGSGRPDPTFDGATVNSIVVNSPVSVLLTNGVQTEITQSGGGSSVQVSDISIGNEGHGWAVLRFNFTNGTSALFHTGKCAYCGDSLFQNGLNLSTTTTKQPVGLRNQELDRSSNTDSWETTESCEKETTIRRCFTDPTTHQRVCQDETIYSTGRRNVTRWTTETKYKTRFDLMSADGGTVLASLNVTGDFTERSDNKGTCE
jgi:hypothetical protein